MNMADNSSGSARHLRGLGGGSCGCRWAPIASETGVTAALLTARSAARDIPVTPWEATNSSMKDEHPHGDRTTFIEHRQPNSRASAFPPAPPSEHHHARASH